MKRKKIFNYIICLTLALVFGATGIGLKSVNSNGYESQTSNKSMTSNYIPGVQDLGVIRPEDIDEGLSSKTLDDIRGRRVTIRQPIMEVLKYDVERPATVKTVGDKYEFLDFKTGEKIHDLAEVTFDGKLGDKNNPQYPMLGLNNSPKDKDEQTYFSTFKKYALLRQAYYFNTHWEKIIENDELAKHPAADYIYGQIPSNAKAVSMRIVTDPLYTSPMTTGLYLVPGEVATIKIKGLKAGEKLNLYTHHQDTLGYKGYNENNQDVFKTMEDYFAYWDSKIVARAKAAASEKLSPDFTKDHYGLQGQWKWQNQKVPCMSTKFDIVGDGSDEMTVKIGSMYGGPLYFQPTSTPVEMIIDGAVLTPHFVLGVTKLSDFENHYKKAPGLIATLDVENGQLIGPAEDMRNCDDMEKLAYFWHSVFAIDISLNGRAYNYNMTMCYDMHVPAGEAVALNSNFCAQPTYWFGTCMNYQKLTTQGNWGTLHELGHTQAATYGVNWGFAEGDGEVWNNTLILVIYSMLCNMDTRVTYVEHGEFVHPYTAVERSLKITKTYEDKKNPGIYKAIEDYGQINNGDGAHFDQLSMYSTLLHSFGPEKFIDMFYTYKLNSAYCSNKRADFVYRIGLVDRVNILNWVNENYFARISEGYFSKQQLAFLKSLPDFYPIAYRWANGIDGNETARKYEVDGKFKTIFDLSGDNILSYKDFDILDVTDAKYGKTHYDSTTQKVTYEPPQKITEFDSFDIIVRTLGGRKVSLNVNLKLLYRGTYAKVWDLGPKDNSFVNQNKPSIEVARKYALEHDPTGYEESATAGKNDFTHQNIEYYYMQFRYVAPEEGKYTFYLRADDASCVNFYREDDINGTSLGTMTTLSDKQKFSNEKGRYCEINLTEGQTIDVVAELVNWGGLGHLHIGVKTPSSKVEKVEEVPEIAQKDMVNAGVSAAELKIADSFKGWQPHFVDSIKDATIDTKEDNTAWKILEAPLAENDDMEASKMIDGNENTFYHSHYSGGNRPNLPHTFVFDMKENKNINFFEILRREKDSDKITNFALYAREDCLYREEFGGTNTEGWTQLFNGIVQKPEQQRIRVTFNTNEYRYLKLIINSNGGNSVIKEIYAGLTSDLNQTVKPSHYKTDDGIVGFEENPANGKLTTETNGAIFEFEFLGSSFEIFSDIGKDFGSANVYIDNASPISISLDSEKTAFNRCVFTSGQLKLGPHKVKVETTSNKQFNISFINVIYGTPVDEKDYPALQKDGKEDFGNEELSRQFTREWKTYVSDYQEITSIKFVKEIPEDYEDTYIRIDTYIRVYRAKADKNKIAIVYPGKIVAPSECGSLFAGCTSLTDIDFTNFDTSAVRGAVSMFNGCTSITTIDLSKFQTGDMQSIGTMFANCFELKNVDLSGLKLMKDVNCYNMFANCVKLTNIKFPSDFEGEVKFQFPYVYKDKTTGQYVTEVVLNSLTAGHEFEVHATHTFNKPTAHHPYLEPKCTQEGSIEFDVCDECNFKFVGEDRNELIEDSELSIPATDHYAVEDTENTLWPTCTAGGGYSLICQTCGEKLGSNSSMPPNGHYYYLDTREGGNGYDFVDNKDGTGELIVHLYCTSFDFNHEPWIACDSVVNIKLYLRAVETPATCTVAAAYTFSTSVTRDLLMSMINSEEKEIKDNVSDYFNTINFNLRVEGESALGHSYVSSWGQWIKKQDKYTHELTLACEREGCEHTKILEVVTSSDITEASCEEDGIVVYTSTYTAPEETNDVYDQKVYSDSMSEVILRLRHNYKPVDGTPLEWKTGGHNKAILHLMCEKCTKTKDIEIASRQTSTGSFTCGQNATDISYTVDLKNNEILNEIQLQIGENDFEEDLLRAIDTLSFTEASGKIYHIWELESRQWNIENDKLSATLVITLRCSRCNQTISLSFAGIRTSVDATCESAEQITFIVETKNIEEVYEAAVKGQLNGVTIDRNDQFIVLAKQNNTVEGQGALGHDFSGECKSVDNEAHIVKCIRCETYSEERDHDFDVTWNWGEYNNGNPILSATLRCEDCHHIIEKSGLTPVRNEGHSNEASCTKEGAAVFDASFELNGKTYSAAAKHYYLEMLGHNYFATWNWGEYNNGNPSLDVELKCERCQAEANGELKITLIKEAASTEATCVLDGNMIYNAMVEFDGKTYFTQEEHSFVIAKLGHHYHVTAINWAKDIKHAKDTTVDVECSNCQEKLDDAVVTFEKNGNSLTAVVKYGDQVLTFKEGVNSIHVYKPSNIGLIIGIIGGAVGTIALVTAAVVVIRLSTKKKRAKFDKN